VLHLVDDGLLDVFGVVPVGQVQQDREPGGALDERADGCFASMFVRQVRQCFSAVWADGFPRCRHRFPVM